MKKLFALFMVVAMLSVAGTAMATSITASRTDVELERGSNTTVTVTGTASHGSALEYSLVYGTGMTSEWASLNGTTVTLTAPSTASKGFYTVIVRATETYSESDEAGHFVARTDTADVSITVNVLVPSTPNTDGGSQKASSKTETLILVGTKKVSTKSPKAASVNVASTADAKKPTANDSKVKDNASDYGSRLGQTGTVELVGNNEAEFEEYEKSGQDLVDQKAAEMAEALGSSAKGNERLGPPQPRRKYPKPGLSTMDLNYGSDFAGSLARLIMKAVDMALGNSEFSASATEDVIFLDKDGNEVTTIPEDGVVTAVTYVEGGTTYDPIVFAEVPADKLTAFDTATGTEEKTVELETVTIVTETVNSTETFSPVVSDARVIQAVSDDYGKPVTMLPYTTASTTKTWSASTEETSYMTANNLVYVCSLPVLENIPDGTYIAAITFDNTPSLDVVGAPKFYPNGVSATGAATSAKLYTYANGSATEITASNAKDVVVNGRSVYLVFEVAGGAVATADFDAAEVTLTAPSIVVSNTNRTPTPVIDAKVQELIAAGYVTADGTALTDAAFASTPVFNQDGDVVSTTVTLNFPVASWYLYVAGSQIATADFEASATGTITKNGDNSASGTIDRSTIASGTTVSVSFGVIPTGSDITTPLTHTLGNVTGTGSDIRGVGSSSGGCSTASAVLALAVLGSFVLTRKR